MEGQNAVETVAMAVDKESERSAELNYLNTKFKLAARRANVKLLEELREKGAEVDHADGTTALISAVQSEDYDCFKYLVEVCGAGLDVANAEGETTLHYACFLGQVEMVSLLLEKKVDVNAVSKTNVSAFNYCMFSKTPELSLRLLEEGGAAKAEGAGPLAFSLVSRHDKPKILAALINKGGVQAYADDRGNNLAHLVVQSQREKCVDLVMTSMPELFDRANAEGQLPIHMAALQGKARLVEKILLGRRTETELQLSSADASGRYAVHYAASSHYSGALSLVADAGADLGAEDKRGTSPLTLACVAGNVDNVKTLLTASEDSVAKHAMAALGAAVHAGHTDVVVALCKNVTVQGAGLRGTPQTPDESPFLLAAYYGHAKMIEAMVSRHEGLLDQQDAAGKTVLHICASNGNIDALKYLCSVLHEDYLNIFTKLGRNALWYAACGGHADCVRLLLEHGVNNDMGDNLDISPLAAACRAGHVGVLRTLVDSGMDINVKNTDGTTPLMQAAISGQTKLVKVLLDLGADINLPDKQKLTPLHHAATRGQAEMCALLVRRGANLGATDKNLRTPLHSAVYYGRSVVATALLRLGADAKAVDKRELTCSAAASSVGHHDLARLLEKGLT